MLFEVTWSVIMNTQGKLIRGKSGRLSTRHSHWEEGAYKHVLVREIFIAARTETHHAAYLIGSSPEISSPSGSRPIRPTAREHHPDPQRTESFTPHPRDRQLEATRW